MARSSYTPEEIEQRFNALPADVQAYVYSSDMLNTIQALGTKYQLHIDQVGALEAEAADVMTGFSKAEEFVANLKEALGVDDSKAQNIAKDINEQLFVKIRESMKGSPQKPLETPHPTAPPPTPVIPKPDLSGAEGMLSQKNVTSAPLAQAPVVKPPAPIAPITQPAAATPPTGEAPPKQEPPKPQNYSADPYREPPV